MTFVWWLQSNTGWDICLETLQINRRNLNTWIVCPRMSSIEQVVPIRGRPLDPWVWGCNLSYSYYSNFYLMSTTRLTNHIMTTQTLLSSLQTWERLGIPSFLTFFLGGVGGGWVNLFSKCHESCFIYRRFYKYTLYISYTPPHLYALKIHYLSNLLSQTNFTYRKINKFLLTTRFPTH